MSRWGESSLHKVWTGSGLSTLWVVVGNRATAVLQTWKTRCPDTKVLRSLQFWIINFRSYFTMAIWYLNCQFQIYLVFQFLTCLKQYFRPRVLAHPCNPTTWRSRTETGRVSCLVRRLVSKSCLIITHPVALPPKYCVGSVGRIASGKVVVIRQLQPSVILWF